MSDTDDESLDVTSSKFDPLKALYAPKLPLTVPNAPIYDNVSKFYSTKLAPKREPSRKKVPKETEPSTSGERKFLPHQMPVSAPRFKRPGRTVLTRMESVKGPLAVLRECVNSQIRIKVVTRSMNGIRGYCEAFVVAFDRHWNLALKDVREVWTRKKKAKVPSIGSCGTLVESTPATGQTVLVLKSGKKEELLERHVPQLLLRGEHVAIISVLR
ncbi:U7 snRNA-associated Sm-like protein LSm11 isoform X1 [Schistocerca piceifrons]|uniref:U7 snRNA-associated Sm-like protein LSm11 isoform X1 n=1 Tax=Schistocerca piceifrons TaxID=274613 RepID=UPI001F5EBED9|nr:U7 snRNA-associated Sm-like protein LSm11 isoform X1 [Schistocerca piceifrons]